MQKLADIRSAFINYFKQQGHEHVSSSSLVPQNDPTLLFTNAGMVQFKDTFTGVEKRPYTRAVTAQKCVRAGGKHNDLENVGYTARHHTFFEMLGNFSFGDYFKEEAISHAWQLITKDFAIPAHKLLVTVYSEDEEAASLWRKIAGLSDKRIIRIPTTDNFWSMGDTGPCGPCTEIFYDHGEGIPGGPPGSADEDGDRFIEIWNLVFMQYEQLASGERINLPKPSVDTGMGIERIAAVMQGVHNNYDTDLFKTIIAASSELTGANDPKHRQSHNVIADHLRACSFLLADGVMPSNEGRGYVLRRIMRRAMRHAHIIGAKEPLMHRLVHTLVTEMGSAYPELGRAQAMIQENLKLEEERFRQTLERGLRLLEDETSKLSASQGLPGAIAFKLYDTFGFPLDLTQDVLRSQNRDVDLAGFESAMAAQRATARAAWSGSGDAINEQVWYDLKEQFGSTEFLGYDLDKAEGLIQALVAADNQPITEAGTGTVVHVLCNQTPFYAESGGQQGDHGLLETASGSVAVTDTVKKVGGLHVHVGHVTSGTIKQGQAAALHIDRERRQAIRANHSATHLLHAALRHQLGAHVTQKGSLVAAERLRFDFTHTKALTAIDLQTIELEVNHQILANHAVGTHLMDVDSALAHGAMALFGERYGDEVRVLSMGNEQAPYSIELCGGTHVSRTGDIGLFKIIGEAGISAGIRRIEAVTGLGALAYVQDLSEKQSKVNELLKAQGDDAIERLVSLQHDRRQLERQVTELRQKLAVSGGGQATTSAAKQVGSYQLMSRQLTDVPAKDLKPLVDQLKSEIGSGVIVVTSVVDDKVALVIGVTADLTDRVDAVHLVKIGAEALGGKGGGGRADMAQAGGNDPAAVLQALKAIEQSLI